VVIAHEADRLASCQLLDLAADVLLHDHLPAMAQIERRLALAGVSERLFAACERVLQHHEHAIRAERGLGSGPGRNGAQLGVSGRVAVAESVGRERAPEDSRGWK